MNNEQSGERKSLLAELIRLQSEFESSFVTDLIEPVLSLRLTMQQLKVLMILVTQSQESSIQELSKTMGVSLATMSGIVDRLESQDMVIRTLDPHDQRVRRVSSSELGTQTVQRLVAARPELRDSQLSLLEIDDLRALTQGIRALVQLVNNANSMSSASDAAVRTSGISDESTHLASE